MENIKEEVKELILTIDSLKDSVGNDKVYNVCSDILNMLQRNDTKDIISDLEAIVNKTINIDSVFK